MIIVQWVACLRKRQAAAGAQSAGELADCFALCCKRCASSEPGRHPPQLQLLHPRARLLGGRLNRRRQRLREGGRGRAGAERLHLAHAQGGALPRGAARGACGACKRMRPHAAACSGRRGQFAAACGACSSARRMQQQPARTSSTAASRSKSSTRISRPVSRLRTVRRCCGRESGGRTGVRHAAQKRAAVRCTRCASRARLRRAVAAWGRAARSDGLPGSSPPTLRCPAAAGGHPRSSLTVSRLLT